MYEAFQDFVRKDLDVLESIDGSQFDKASWSSLSSAGNTIIRYNEDVFLIGHSFGGATSVSQFHDAIMRSFTDADVS
jgi:hypothetical protein